MWTRDINGPVHRWFGLTYSSYLVVPRLALQEMPLDWQERFVALMEEAEALGFYTPGDYHVARRGASGRFFSDPWADYRRSTVSKARARDALGERTESEDTP